MQTKLAIYGSGGHAREVAAQMKAYLEKEGIDLRFYVDDPYVSGSAHPISAFDPAERSIMVAVADPGIRQHLVESLPVGTTFFTFIHPTAQLFDADRIHIGEGSFIGAHSILTTDIRIGRHAILNRGNHVGHDFRSGDYLSLMPGAIISGNVTVGDRVFMGTASTVKEKLSICDDVTVGMSSGVILDIRTPGVYVGVPARRMEPMA
jgi:sugar O-acyltransferase (sialic acid O-acetyltransferase NeuD family)